MGRKQIFGIFILIVLAGLFSCKKSPDIIASVGDLDISRADFENILRQRRPRMMISQIPLDERKKILTDYLEDKAKAMKARDLNYHKDPELQQQVTRREERVLAAKYPEILITDKFVTPEMVQAFAQIQSRKPRMIAVALGFEESKLIHASRTKEQAITIADSIYQRVKEGADIAEESSRYTDNSNLKKLRGLYNPYSPGALDPEVDIQVSHAKTYQLLEPIETDRGIFVIQVLESTDTSKVALSEQEKARTKVQIYNKFYRPEGDSIYKALSEKFSQDLGSEVYDEGIEQFLRAVEEWAATGSPTDKTFTEQQRAIVLGRISDITITAGYFIDEFQGTFRTSHNRFNNHDALKNILQDYIQRYLAWIIKAREAGIDKLPDVKKIVNDFMDGKLVEIFEKEEIQGKAAPTSEQIQAFYEKNKENYVDPQKIKIWEIALKDEKTAQTILKKAKMPGTNFESLARQYTEKVQLKERGGSLGYQSIKSPRKVIKAAFDAGENQIIGPVQENRYFYILKTGDILPERRKELQEVETLVKSGAQRENEQALREEWIQKLKQEFDIWINEKELEQMS